MTMWSLALAALLLVPTPDTLTVRPGDVLVVERLSGRLVLQGSDDNELSVVEGDTDAGFQFERRGAEIRLRAVRGRRLEGRISLRVPENTRIVVSGEDLDVDIEGMRAGISVETVDGDVVLRRTVGTTEIYTLDGDLSVTDAAGPLTLSTLDGEIEVTGLTGPLRAETTDGDVTLRGIVSASVRASTLDGDVLFDGEIGATAMISLATHSGGIEMLLPADVSAEFEVSTVDGNFESAFPVRVGGVQAREALRFSLGDGQARIQIQNFDGDIRLLRR